MPVLINEVEIISSDAAPDQEPPAGEAAQPTPPSIPMRSATDLETLLRHQHARRRRRQAH